MKKRNNGLTTLKEWPTYKVISPEWIRGGIQNIPG